MHIIPYTEQEGHTVLSLPAHLAQDDWLGFRDLVHRQFSDRRQLRLVIDCVACPALPSIAYGALTCLAHDLRRVGGSMHLVRVSEMTSRFLSRSRLSAIIQVGGTLAEILTASCLKASATS